MEKLLLKEEEEEEEVFGPRKESDESYDPANKKNCSGRKLYSGVIEKFQRGDGGFSALWKRRWVVVEKGWLKCYATDCRPAPATKYEPEEKPLVFMPLTNKATTIENTMTSAFRKKFGGRYSFTVASSDM